MNNHSSASQTSLNPIVEHLREHPVIAVVVTDDPSVAVELARRLCDNHIRFIELALRLPNAVDSIYAIRREVPDMFVGAGTVLTPEDVDAVVSAGAYFGVAPGLNPTVVKHAQRNGLYFSPGIATPTELELAVDLGCTVLKFFPAEALGGISYLKSMAAPYRRVEPLFIPLGGITNENFCSYLASEFVLGVGGSWLAPEKALANRDWGLIDRSIHQVRQRLENFRSR